MINNKISFTFDYYDRKTTDIIMEVPVPTEFALGAYKDNVGAMRNRGVEMQLGYTNQWGDWKFGVVGNFAYNKNKIENLGGVNRMSDGDFMRFSRTKRHKPGWINMPVRTDIRSA